MTTTIAAARVTVRILGAIVMLLGIVFWTGHLLTLISLHMLLGMLFVLALWTLAALAARAGAAPGLVALSVLWGLAVPALGMTQDSLLPGSAHWVIQVLHLVVGMVAIGLGEALYRRARSAHGGAVPA